MTQPALRLFVPDRLSAGRDVPLSADQLHYAATVMRRESGAPLLLFNGQDGEWAADLVLVSKKKGHGVVARQTRAHQASPDLSLLFAPVKRAPIDQIAQKATELGVSSLCPVRTERTVVSRVNLDRLQANAVEAAEQCERLDVPQVHELQKLSTMLERWQDTHPGRLILYCDEAGDAADARWGGEAGRAAPVLEVLADYRGSRVPWAILIGPEGGFSPEERTRLRDLDFVIPATLGPRILRADTAAFAAITLWQAALGDL